MLSSTATIQEDDQVIPQISTLSSSSSKVKNIKKNKPRKTKQIPRSVIKQQSTCLSFENKIQKMRLKNNRLKNRKLLMEIKNVEREHENLNLINEKLKIGLAAMKTVL